MEGYRPFEVLKEMKIDKRKCPHKWTKDDGKIICEVCGATGFYSKEQDKIFMKKNSANNKISIIDNALYTQFFGDK